MIDGDISGAHQDLAHRHPSKLKYISRNLPLVDVIYYREKGYRPCRFKMIPVLFAGAYV